MTDQEIKVGDIVVLKSDGPKMTVIGKSGENLICQWFVAEAKQENFNPEALFLLKDHPKHVAPKLLSF